MKTLRILSMAVLAATFVFSSCSKYEEGPAFSLLPKKTRLTGEWEVEKYVDANGEETNASGDDATMQLNSDNTAELKMNFFGTTAIVNGEWEFIDDKEGLRLTLDFNGNESVEESKILRLKNKELWLEDENGGETHYVKAD